MKQRLLVLWTIFLFSSCGNDSGKGCWEAVNGPSLGRIEFNPPLCDITKKKAEEKYPNYWFYRAGTATNCYRVQYNGNTYYIRNMSEDIAQRHSREFPAYQYTKIDCSSFCNITWHRKTRSKVTGQYGCCIRQTKESLFNPDSCSKLFVGRVFTVSETADSITTIEVFQKN